MSTLIIMYNEQTGKVVKLNYPDAHFRVILGPLCFISQRDFNIFLISMLFSILTIGFGWFFCFDLFFKLKISELKGKGFCLISKDENQQKVVSSDNSKKYQFKDKLTISRLGSADDDY